ncbi:MAG: Ig-like domain-containing protein [Calditrichaeota bacterium]|nr:Ig-like domain-containing protein [Calditrichota bacterium]
MAGKNRHFFNITFIISINVIILFLFYSCAVKGMPSGGPPDKTPPTIISTFPTPDSTGVKNLSVIRFEFSESMNEGSIANTIFISPPLKFKAEWQSDDELEIQLQDSLKADQTYVIVLGANIRDLRSNKLAESYQLAFATGDKIDHGKIYGTVYNLARNQTYTLFAYKLTSDTIRFNKNTPDYVSQSGENGNFVLNYLSNGLYRIFAVEDQNNNLMIDSDFEMIAIPHRDVRLDSISKEFKGLNFQPTKIDTLPPKLTNIRSISNKLTQLRLSEKIVLPQLSQIQIKDSLTLDTAKVLAVSRNIEADNILEVYTSILDSGKVYLCSIKAFRDSTGNTANDTIQSFTTSRPAKKDSFQVVTILPADSAWNVYPSPVIYFETNQPLDKSSLGENFSVSFKSGKAVKGKIEFPSAFEAYFKPEVLLPLDSVFVLKADLSKIRNVWSDSLADSVVIRYFKISNGDDYGEITGNIFSPDSSNLNFEIDAVKFGNKEKYHQQVKQKTDYKMIYIPDGQYKMHIFQDLDSNNVFSPGSLYPFNYSEPFTVGTDTIKVRKRWETSGVNLYLPE